MRTQMHPWKWGMLALAACLLSATSIAAQTATTAPSEEAPADLTPPPAATTKPATQTPATAPAADEATVRQERPGTFEVHFHEAGLRQAFQLLSSEGHKNIVATKDVTGKVTADLYGVTFREALEAVLKSTGYVYEEEGNFVYVMTADQKKKSEESRRKMMVATYRLAYLTAADAKILITPAMSKDGMIAITPAATAGIAANITDAGGNNYAADDVLVVRDYEENIARIGDIIHDVDVKPEQVLIEATILRATLTENNDLGIDFSTLAGVSFDQLGFTTKDFTNINTPAVPTPINGSNTPAAGFRTDVSSTVPKGGLSLGFVTNDIGVFVRALETVTDTTILANPKLLVVNKQRGEVMIGNRDGYLTTTVTETTATQSVEFLETGTRLIVRPYLGRNGLVRMEIHPEDSSGSVSLVGTSALPSETTTEITSNVLVRDGHTIVIGGLFHERTIAGRTQVPLAGNIPILGAAFRSTSDTTVREEVIILITPHIIRQEEDEATSQQIKDDVERMRVGARKGLMWWGRPRLAQTYLRWAKEAVAEGKCGKAMCNLDMALSLEPRMIDAIQLKERLTDQAYWHTEPRPSTTRIIVEQLMMQELGMPVELIVPPCKPLHERDIAPAVRQQQDIGERKLMPLCEQVECVFGPCCVTTRTVQQPAKTGPKSSVPAPKAGPRDAAPPAMTVKPAPAGEAASGGTDLSSDGPGLFGQTPAGPTKTPSTPKK